MIWHFVDAKHLSISLASEILPVISTTLILTKVLAARRIQAIFRVRMGISGSLGYIGNVVLRMLRGGWPGRKIDSNSGD
jgi:hypothetical protein